MPSELWKPIQGYEGTYSISSLGRVASEYRVMLGITGKKQTVRWRILRCATKRSGHLSVCLYGHEKPKRMHVHRLVALAFIGDPPTPAHEVAHNDGNPSNNEVTNLRWATRSENHGDKVSHGTHNRGSAHPLSKLTPASVQIIRRSSLPTDRLAERFQVSRKHICAVKTGKAWRWM